MAIEFEKYVHSSVVDDRQATGYVGIRTDGTVQKTTRLRRLFSFAQIFFFALGYMSSWEAASHSILF